MNRYGCHWSRLVRPLAFYASLSIGCLAWLALTSNRAWGQQVAVELNSTVLVETVEELATIVKREYFDKDVATRVAVALRKSLADGSFGGVKTHELLAKKLTQEMFAVTQDKHLAVTTVNSDRDEPPSDREAIARRTNFGVQRVEILVGNVGYLNLTAFYRLEEGREAISAAMKVLRSSDALIIDMRENGGGSPDTVALLASFLFDDPGVPLFEIVPRSGDSVQAYKTHDVSKLDRNGVRPAYVLTSRQTFSAGEGFPFLVQERHRAEIVGETTAGAANPGRHYTVNAFFEVAIPNGQVRTAIAGRNWEGKGVVPDVPVPASDALRTAHARALRELLKRNWDKPWQETLTRQVEVLER